MPKQTKTFSNILDEIIISALKEHGFNQTLTAKILGISRRQICERLRRLRQNQQQAAESQTIQGT